MLKQGKKIPIYHRIIQPIIHHNIQPVISIEIQTVINKKIQPVVHKEVQSIIHQEIQPVIILEMNPNFNKYIQLIIHKVIQPVIHKEIQPIIHLETQPVIIKNIHLIINEMIQPVVFYETQTNIEEMIQQIYQSYKQEYEKEDSEIKVELKGLNPDKNYNLQNIETFNITQFPKKIVNFKNEIVPYIIKEEKKITQNIVIPITQKEVKNIEMKIIQPMIMREEVHILKRETFPKTEKYTNNNIEQFEVVPYIMKEEKHTTQREVKPLTETVERNIKKIIIVPYIRYKNGEELPYEKKDKEEKAYTKADSVNMGKIIAVIFKSLEYNINYPIACQKTDIFEKIENQLYHVFPELKSKNIYFIANGNAIDKTATFEANRIKTGDTILINKNEFESYNYY